MTTASVAGRAAATTDSVETRYSWVLAVTALGILSVSSGAPTITVAAARAGLIQPDSAVLAVFAAIISERHRLRRKNPGVPTAWWSKEPRVTASRHTVDPLYQENGASAHLPATNPPSPPNRNRQFDGIALIC